MRTEQGVVHFEKVKNILDYRCICIEMTRIDQIIESILHHVEPEAIILFGSRIKGLFGPASDYDVLIIVNALPETFEERLTLENAIGDEIIFSGIFLSPVLVTCSEFIESIQKLDLLMLEIYRNHEVLSDKGIFYEGMEKMKELIKERKIIWIPETQCWTVRNV